MKPNRPQFVVFVVEGSNFQHTNWIVEREVQTAINLVQLGHALR